MSRGTVCDRLPRDAITINRRRAAARHRRSGLFERFGPVSNAHAVDRNEYQLQHHVADAELRRPERRPEQRRRPVRERGASSSSAQLAPRGSEVSDVEPDFGPNPGLAVSRRSRSSAGQAARSRGR